MSYDFEDDDRSPPSLQLPAREPRRVDLVEMAVEIAAISLTPRRGAEFSMEQLLAESNAMRGGHDAITEDEVASVVGGPIERCGSMLLLK